MITKGYTFSGFVKVTAIPEGVKRILPGSLTRLWQTDTLVLPSTLEYFVATAITDLEREHRRSYNIKEIKIENNEHYTTIDGILYTKDLKTLVYVPAGKTIKELIIPEGVEEIGEGACAYVSGGDFMQKDCKCLLPSTIRKISKNAFYKAKTKIDFVPRDAQLEEGCFNGCTLSKRLELHNEIIPTNAFLNSLNVTVRLYETVKEIKKHSFCAQMDKIYIPPNTIVDKEAIAPIRYSTGYFDNDGELEYKEHISFGVLEIGGQLGSSAHQFALANGISFDEVENTSEAIEAFFNKPLKPNGENGGGFAF